MDFKIIETTNKIIKTECFEKLNKEEQIELILNNMKSLISKFLLSFQVNIDSEEKLSYMVLELNEYLDYDTKQKFNQELSHALINALIKIEKHNIEWAQTTDRHLRINPVFTYDLNMTLQSIKTYNEMDLGNLSVLLLKTVEANLSTNNTYKLKNTK